MATVRFTYALQRFYPDMEDMPANGNTLHEVLNEVEGRYPRIKTYLLDDQGTLRGHVNIFIDGRMISDREGLTDSFKTDSTIYIIQALSGG
jgi:sulfur-carrier protein